MPKSFSSIDSLQSPVELMADTASLVGNVLGGALGREDAYALLKGCETVSLLRAAARLRTETKPGNLVTYSRKVFINLVNLCRDTCSYCTYKKELGDSLLSMMGSEQVLALAEAGKRSRCTEALFVTGERPEQKYAEASEWLHSHGHTSTVGFIEELSGMVLEKTGLIPHTNAGSLTKKEMSQLKETNASLGVMLESASERLMGPGMPHEDAPSKNPKVRMKTLENAGELQIPMTTGLLIGIGETPEEVVDSLFAIKAIHEKYSNIQEVIMQNFAPKPGTEMAGISPPPYDYFLRTVAMARIIMPKMNVQVPPNLNPDVFGTYLDAGINDWGGISPVTMDHVNPEFPWPSIPSVKKVTEGRGFSLRARLPVYPEFVTDRFITSERIKQSIKVLANETGLVKEDYYAEY